MQVVACPPHFGLGMVVLQRVSQRRLAEVFAAALACNQETEELAPGGNIVLFGGGRQKPRGAWRTT